MNRRSHTASFSAPGASRYFSFSLLRLSVAVHFPNPGVANDVLNVLAGHPRPFRVVEHTTGSRPMFPIRDELSVEFGLRDDQCDVSLTIDEREIMYATPVRRFCRDFWKVLHALVYRAALLDGVVCFHAACVASQSAALLLGVSGAGKTSVAVEAKSHTRVAVHATELTFTRSGRLVAGNAMSDFDSRGLASEPMRAEPGVKVTSIVFPRLREAALEVKEVQPARSQALMFENSLSVSPVTTLISHETVPIGPLLDLAGLEAIARETQSLSSVPAFICEGTPSEIWRFIYALDRESIHPAEPDD